MATHESAFVHVTVDAIESSFTRILPHLKVSSVTKHRGALGILGYHELVTVEFAEQIVVVEVGTRIDEWLLLVGFLHEVEELEQGVAELLCIHATFGFHINHWQEVLVARATLRHEVLQLGLLWDSGTIKVV